MIKALFLIFAPVAAWDRVARQRRGFLFVLGFYLLPMIFITAVVEGWGLHRWGKWQPKFEVFKQFSTHTVVNFELTQAILALLMVLVSALVVLKISQTFEGRHSYRQAFVTMAYGFSPLFLVRLFDAGASVSPWVTWAAGLMLTIWVLYQGIPRVMQPDPTHAFGLYLAAVIVAALMSGVARVLTALYLLGWVDFQHSGLAYKFPSLFH